MGAPRERNPLTRLPSPLYSLLSSIITMSTTNDPRLFERQNTANSQETTYTVESLISELTRLTTLRGWGAQSTTNISKVVSPSGTRQILLLTGNEKDIEALEKKNGELTVDVATLVANVENLEQERDALRRAVDKLTHEVRSLKNAARQ